MASGGPTRDPGRHAGGIAALDRDLGDLLLAVATASELLDQAPSLADPRRVVAEIATTIQEEFAFSRTAVWRWEPDTRSFVGLHSAGVSPRLVRSLRIPFGPVLPLARAVIHDGRWEDGEHMPGDGTDPLAALAREIYAGLGERPARCLLAPLQAGGLRRCFRLRPRAEGCPKAEAGPFAGLMVRLSDETLRTTCLACPVFPVAGLIWADGRKSAFVNGEGGELDPLWLTLAQADLLFEAATLLESFGRRAGVATPGVSDEARFRILLHSEVERAVRTGQPVALVLIGLEGASPGSEGSGDGRLARIADFLVPSVRRLDRIGRTGPQEMGVLLPRVNATEAAAAVERLRSRLAEEAGGVMEAPLAAGLAIAPDHASDGDELLGMARYALHRARARSGATHVFGAQADPATCREEC